MTEEKQVPEGPRLLRIAIAERGLSSQAAAASAGLHAVQMSHFARGKRTPSIAQAAQLEDALGVPVRSWLPGSQQ